MSRIRSIPSAVASIALVCLLATTAFSADHGNHAAHAARAGHIASPRLLDQATDSTSSGAASSHHIRTVFLILMENHDWSEIKGNASAPFINHTLLRTGAHADHYYNPPGIHPSLPNYLWLEAGTNFGVRDDGPPSANSVSTHAHLVSLLGSAGISWKSYQENIGGAVCPLDANYPYAVKHDPQVYFIDVTNNNRANSAACIAHVRPYTTLAADLAHNRAARYNFITPNLCDDMHDACGPAYNAVKQGDTWLARNVPAILNSRAYKQGGALFVTWDESESGDGPIGMIVLSPFARAGYAGSVRYTHSSTLRSMEEIFGVRPFLGDAAHAADLRALFTAFP